MNNVHMYIVTSSYVARLESQILYYYSIPEFFHAIAFISMHVLLLCSNYAHFSRLRNTSKPLCTMSRTYKLWHWRPSLLALHPCCHYGWSESLCYCPHTGCCFTCFFESSQLTLPYWFAAMWWFAHVPCYYSSIMLKRFGFQIFPYYAQHNQLEPIHSH